MLRQMECRLNFKNRPVRTRDIKGGGGPKQPPATNRGSQEPATNRVNIASPAYRWFQYKHAAGLFFFATGGSSGPF